MYNIKLINNIAKNGLKRFSEKDFSFDENKNADGFIVRSASLHDMEFDKDLLAIARAGAGVNNIPIEKCSNLGIPVFNAPGGNANAVKELVLAALLLSSRKIIESYNWIESSDKDNLMDVIEENKKRFAGPELKGKTLGVVGLGFIGVLVSNAAINLGMDVVGYDPYLSIDSAINLSPQVKIVDDIDSLVTVSDYITLHIPLTDDTKNLFNEELISKAKDGLRLLNYSRSGLVDNNAVIKSIKDGHMAKYVTDFPEEVLLGIDNIIMTPHLGASTPESEENCAIMVAEELRAYLLFGNVKNSVNYPNCVVPYNNKPRLTIMHKNIRNMIGQFTAILCNHDINIDKLVNNSKKELAYSIIVCDELNKVNEIIEALSAIDGVIRIRYIK